jgi:hypothetical protein
MANNADIFAEALQKLNEEYDAKGVNTPTRVNSMLQVGLMHADAFKIANTKGHLRSVLSEAEFLAIAKRIYWQTRASIQAEPAPKLEPASSG